MEGIKIPDQATTMHTRPSRCAGGALLAWIVVLLLLLGGAASYYWLHPEEMPEWAAKTGIGRDLQTTKVYKWQDESGAWHVSDQPPPAGTEYEVGDYARDINVLPLPPALQR